MKRKLFIIGAGVCVTIGGALYGIGWLLEKAEQEH